MYRRQRFSFPFPELRNSFLEIDSRKISQHLRNRPFLTDTASILNLLDLRSIMGCPGGTRLFRFTRAFQAKRELQCKFLGKKAIIITSKHGTTIFFSQCNLFLGKIKEKLACKARVNTERVYRILLIPPGHLIILLKSN